MRDAGIGFFVAEATGEMFVFEEPADDGGEITVFVPKHQEYFDYPHGVSSAVDTLVWIERRPKEAVWADLNATVAPAAEAGAVAPAPTTPTSPVDPVTP